MKLEFLELLFQANEKVYKPLVHFRICLATVAKNGVTGPLVLSWGHMGLNH